MVLFVGTMAGAFASHFRYGVLTATRLSETGTTVTYRLNTSMAWRLGAAPTSAFFAVSGGNSTSFNMPLTVVNDPSGGWQNATGSYTITLNKSATPTRVAFASGAKISDLSNNANGNWDVYAILNTNAPGSTPVSNMPAIINMPVNASAATYSIPASDPDPGSTLTYGLPVLNSGQLSGQTEPSGFSYNATTGQITMNTNGKAINQLYNAMVTVTDNNGNQIMLDFIIKIVGPSTPPVFDYSTTPLNGAVYNAIVGQNVSFPITATDADAGSSVSLSVAGLPSYITTGNFSPAFPATGNPAHTNFSWTPTAAQIGTTNVLNFIATDEVGVQTSTSVTVKVVAQPAPDFIAPTPIQASLRQIVPGVLFQDQIVAKSSLNSNVSIAFATIPAGSFLTPGIPTVGADPGQTTFNWTPLASDFGIHSLNFQAVISDVPTIFATRNYQLIVNTPPAFTSTPTVASINAGQPFLYNITVSDPDLPYGDHLDIVSAGLPAWLHLTDNGNGTATLSGTPGVNDGGLVNVSLEAEDTYHHGNPSPVTQDFTIKVITCEAPSIVCPSNISVSTDAGTCGAAVSFGAPTVTGTSPLVTYSVASGSVFNTGTTVVTVTATNDCGTVSCSFTVTVTDSELPTVTAPAAVNATTDAGKCGATVVLANPAANDNCGIASITSDAPVVFPTGTTTVNWTVTDLNGNVATTTQTVTVTDNEKPTITAPAAVSATTAAGTCGATVSLGDATAADNCGVASVANNAPAVFPTGTTTVTWTVTDVNGNTETATQTVTVVDNEKPTITAPGAISKNTDAGVCGAVVSLGNATTADNCGVASVTNNAPAVFPTGTTTVTWTVTDVNGNVATANQLVTVTDNEAPNVVTKPVTVTLVNGTATITAADVNNGSSDNCGIATLAVSKTSFSCANIGANTVTLTVTDVHGLVSSKPAVVTVVGEIPTSTIASVPTSTVYTGGSSTNLYLGYGAQSTNLAVTAGANGSPYTYAWTGSNLSSTTSGSPLFTPTAAGSYGFTVVTTNRYGCKTSSSIAICVADIRVPGTGGSKVYVCHTPPGNTGNPQTLSISVNAVPSHLGNHTGDKLGSCGQAACTVTPASNSVTQVTATAPKESVMGEEATFNVVVLPNPSADRFTLKLSSAVSTPMSLKVMDANGRIMDAKAGLAANSTVQVGEAYTSGVYYAEIVQGASRKVVQLLKVRK